jgi:hypothetical protein
MVVQQRGSLPLQSQTETLTFIGTLAQVGTAVIAPG